jgi:hypothetical protein
MERIVEAGEDASSLQTARTLKPEFEPSAMDTGLLAAASLRSPMGSVPRLGQDRATGRGEAGC